MTETNKPDHDTFDLDDDHLDSVSAGRRGQDGSDLLIVNNGDGSDFLEGGEGFDFVQVNGAN